MAHQVNHSSVSPCNTHSSHKVIAFGTCISLETYLIRRTCISLSYSWHHLLGDHQTGLPFAEGDTCLVVPSLVITTYLLTYQVAIGDSVIAWVGTWHLRAWCKLLPTLRIQLALDELAIKRQYKPWIYELILTSVGDLNSASPWAKWHLSPSWQFPVYSKCLQREVLYLGFILALLVWLSIIVYYILDETIGKVYIYLYSSVFITSPFSRLLNFLFINNLTFVI